MIDVHVPKMGMSTVEVEVLEVYVEAGERVEAGEPLLIVEAEKAETEVTAPAAGVVAEVLIKEGDELEVGDVVARIQPDAG